MRKPIVRRLTTLVCLLMLFAAGTAPGAGTIAAPIPPDDPYTPVATPSVQPNLISYWGMNVYLTKHERLSNQDNLTLLGQSARDAGVQWTREELPWALIEPNQGIFQTLYDSSLKTTADQGFGIIGMLLTTPEWARDGACSSSFWCPPANVNDYAQFAGWMAERYDGDGIDDAPGSPRITAWEIWNEPNDIQLWPNIGGGGDARKRRYGDLLVAAYRAIKTADPTATVLTGGVYIYDGTNDGFAFLNGAGGVFQQVPAARQAFDVFAIHPYIPTDRPDSTTIFRIITVEGRIQNTRNWLTRDIGRPSVPIWITEIGWCTPPGACGDSAAQVSEARQADYLIRSMVIAQQNGVQHTSWFQFEDAFNNPSQSFATAAIVRDYDGSSYPAKPAYTAYRTLTEQLAAMTLAGTGPLHTHVFDPNHLDVPNDGGTYDYRYTCGTDAVDVLWRPTDSIQAPFPVIAGKQITLIQRDGARQPLLPVGGKVTLPISESPLLLRQAGPSQLSVAPDALTLLAETGDSTADGGLQIAGSGCEALAWAASTSNAALTLDAASGVTPATLQITADIQGLPQGTSALGDVTVTGANSAETFTIPVQVKIVPTLYRGYLPIIRR